MACKETAPLAAAMTEAELTHSCVCVCHGSGRVCLLVQKVRGHWGMSPRCCAKEAAFWTSIWDDGDVSVAVL